MSKNPLVCFCFLCCVLKLVSSFEHNVLSTDCTLSSVGQKLDNEITVVFTNEYKRKGLVMIRPQSLGLGANCSAVICWKAGWGIWNGTCEGMKVGHVHVCSDINELLRSHFAERWRLLHLHSYRIWGCWLSQTWFSRWNRGETFLFLYLLCFLQPDLQTGNYNVSYCCSLNHKFWKQSS